MKSFQNKMLLNGKELNNFSGEVNINETKIITNDVLLFSNIFGGLPLKYTKHLNEKNKMELSKPLQMFGFAYITCLMTLSCCGLLYDFTRYLSGDPFIMYDTLSATTAFVDISFYSVTTMVVIVTSGRKYSKLIEMCKVLEKVDRSLRQRPDMQATGLKVLVTFALTTAVLVWTLALELSSNSVKILTYSHKFCMYYTQIAMYLLFTFVTKSLTMRFKHINEKIQQEVVRFNMLLLLKDLSVSNNISGYECSTADRVYILIDGYVELYEALQLANSFYKSQLFAIVCLSFAQATLALYGFFSIIWSTRIVVSKWALFNKGLWALAHSSYLFFLVWPTKTLTREAGKTAPLVCQLLSKGLNDAELRDQLETFLLQLRHFKVEFSALGFFQMNSNLLPLIASSVTTYVVLLIQLKLKDK